MQREWIFICGKFSNIANYCSPQDGFEAGISKSNSLYSSTDSISHVCMCSLFQSIALNRKMNAQCQETTHFRKIFMFEISVSVHFERILDFAYARIQEISGPEALELTFIIIINHGIVCCILFTYAESTPESDNKILKAFGSIRI